MDMANIIGFWPAAAVFLFLLASNFWLPAFVLINVALMTYGRQMLRKGRAKGVPLCLACYLDGWLFGKPSQVGLMVLKCASDL